jgi:hypothetical protein
VPDNEKWNYELLSQGSPAQPAGRLHILVAECRQETTFEAAVSFCRPVVANGDLLHYLSSAPFNPGGPNVNGTAPDYTGTPDVSARVLVVGDRMKAVPAGLYFNPAAFAVPAVGSKIVSRVLGNLQGGAGVMTYPRAANLDATMSKFIPLFGERRASRFRPRVITSQTRRNLTASVRTFSGMPAARRTVVHRSACSTARFRPALSPLERALSSKG